MRKRALTAVVAAIVVACGSFGIARAALVAQGEATVNAASDAGAPIFPGGKPINGGLQKVTQYSKVTGNGSEELSRIRQ
jgi:hypothetical protein